MTVQPREPALCQLYRHTFVPQTAGSEATSLGGGSVRDSASCSVGCEFADDDADDAERGRRETLLRRRCVRRHAVTLRHHHRIIELHTTTPTATTPTRQLSLLQLSVGWTDPWVGLDSVGVGSRFFTF